jgi:chorismate mutase
MMCRGVRGAITVSRDDEDEILAATRELLQAIIRANEMPVDDIASIYFTTTSDLTATYPAYSARQLGWYDAALLCGHEIDVPGGLGRCIRVLIHWNTTRTAKEIVHVYLREARSLRPDRANIPPVRPRQISPVEAAVKFLSMTL